MTENNYILRKLKNINFVHILIFLSARNNNNTIK